MGVVVALSPPCSPALAGRINPLRHSSTYPAPYQDETSRHHVGHGRRSEGVPALRQWSPEWIWARLHRLILDELPAEVSWAGCRT